MSPRGSLWPDINNRIARLAVAAIFNRAPIDAEDWDYDPVIFKANQEGGTGLPPNITDSELRVYRDRLRRLLLTTGIAQNLLDHWYHDAFYDSLPESVTWWYKMFRPRDIEGLAIHVSKNLGWYLDRTKPHSMRELLITPLMAIGSAVWFVLLLLLGLTPWVSFNAVLPLYFVSIISLNIIRARAARGTTYSNFTTSINNAEFYLYLREAYRDTD